MVAPPGLSLSLSAACRKQATSRLILARINGVDKFPPQAQAEHAVTFFTAAAPELDRRSNQRQDTAVPAGTLF